MVGFSFAPAGWAFCDGQLVPISQNDALFVLFGTAYGGDGQETFAMPDLQGRFPLHQGTLAGNTYSWAEKNGTESVTLTTNQMPSHTHVPTATTIAGNQANPNNGLWALTDANQFNAGPADQQMGNANISIVGGSQPHENMSPFLVISFIVSLFGIFPHQ
ncbi:MAG: tail fiber protein [Pyrinomonadaceae bacterium]